MPSWRSWSLRGSTRVDVIVGTSSRVLFLATSSWSYVDSPDCEEAISEVKLTNGKIAPSYLQSWLMLLQSTCLIMNNHKQNVSDTFLSAVEDYHCRHKCSQQIVSQLLLESSLSSRMIRLRRPRLLRRNPGHFPSHGTACSICNIVIICVELTVHNVSVCLASVGE